MNKLASKITVPIILVGLFSAVVFVSLNYNELDAVFYIILLFLSIYIFSFGFAIGQNFSSPVKKLLDMATDLSKGKLDARVYLKTKDELAELADMINKVAEELEETHIDSAMIEKSVDIKTRARTKALEETINALERKVKNRTAELEKILDESKRFKNQAESKEKELMGLKSEIDKLRAQFIKKKPKRKTAKTKKITKTAIIS